MYMNGFHHPYNHYDPWPFFMMMNSMNKEPKEEDELKMFKKYKELFQEMKREFEPPKKDEPKKEDKKADAWTTSDYFTFIVCFVSVSVLGGGYMILRELVEFAKVIHGN